MELSQAAFMDVTDVESIPKADLMFDLIFRIHTWNSLNTHIILFGPSLLISVPLNVNSMVHLNYIW